VSKSSSAIPAVGQKLHGFVITAVHELDEFRAKGIHARHLESSMEVYHVHNDDEENLFAFALRTIPEDSSGVAHILEHTVLCGSERFPIKDPFTLLVKGSMNTFLNAFTFPDKTVYPASSTVPQDLFNLMEVYGDAVYFPQIKPEMFRQEGHRLEFGPDGKLVRSGIVLNEMKGNYSTHDSVAADWCYRSLFPGSSYEHDSGGDPAAIPTLDYETFRAFHKKYYSPGNTLLFLYGNIPTSDYLSFVNSKFLSRFASGSYGQALPAGAVLDVKTFTTPRELTVTCPADPEDAESNSASVTMNWLLPAVTDPLEVLSHEILSELLIGSPASPLQRALVDSGLGEDLSSPSGLETELYRLIFSVGLRGTSEERKTDIAKLIRSTLANICEQGFDKDLVEGTMRRFEFRAREIKGGPFGLRLMRRSLRAWLHGASPDLSLRFADTMSGIRNQLAANPRYFEALVQSRYLDNPHASVVTVLPDASQNAREAAAEEQELSALLASMSPTEQQRIREEQATLKLYQETPDSPEAVAKLPFLGEADIPRTVRTIPQQTKKATIDHDTIPVHEHDIYTNGICYMDIAFNSNALLPEELFFLPTLLGIIPNLGLPGHGYEKTATELSLVSGGFAGYCETSMRMDQSQSILSFFRFKSLNTDIAEAVRLCTSLISRADLSDKKRLLDLFVENRNESRSSIVPSGSAYAAMRSERFFAPSEALEELWRGITQILGAESLEKQLGDKLAPFLSEALQALRKRLLARNTMLLNIAGDTTSMNQAQAAILDWAKSLPEHVMEQNTSMRTILEKHAGKAWTANFLHLCSDAMAPQAPAHVGRELQAEALTLSSKVAFTASSTVGAVLGSKAYAAQSILAHQMRSGQLWERIRMKGGAYGANASNDGLSRTFSFSSYRDPNIASSFHAYRESLADLATNGMSPQDLVLAKIGIVARDIRPLAPAEQSYIALRRSLYGASDALRQQTRDWTIKLQDQDIREEAQSLAKLMQNAQNAVITGSELADKEERQSSDLKLRRHDISPS